MKYFQYTVRNVQGMGSQCAGQIARIARKYPDTIITVAHEDQRADGLKRMKLLGLGAKEGDVLTVTAEGADEVEASIALRNFFQNNL